MWKKLSKILGVVLGLLVIVFVVSLYCSCCPALNIALYNQVLFYPQKEFAGAERLSTIGGIKGEEVSIDSKDSDGAPVKLNGWLYEKKGAPYVCLLNHGNAGNVIHRVHKAHALLAAGCSVLLYDYQGYGKSEGTPDGGKVVRDATQAYDFLISRGYKPEQIIVYGESLGTGVTSELLKSKPARAVILESGFISPEVFAKERIPILNVYPSALFPEPRFNNMNLVVGKHPPLLVIYGVKDSTIPPSCSERLSKSATPTCTAIALPNNGHNDIGLEDRKTYAKALKDFVDALDKAAVGADSPSRELSKSE